MRTIDAPLRDQLDQLRAHFAGTLYHRLLRGIYQQLGFDSRAAKRIEQWIDEQPGRGGDTNEVDLFATYEIVSALGQFVQLCQQRLCRNMTFLIRDAGGHHSHDERLIRELTIRSFDNNVNVLAQRLADCYERAVAVDQLNTAPNRKPISASFPELGALVRNAAAGCGSTGTAPTSSTTPPSAT